MIAARGSAHGGHNQESRIMKQEDDEVVRFCVEADFRSETAKAVVECYSESHKEAIDMFDHLSSRYPCVWLSEFGKYRAGNEWKEAWMYYKWTTATGWGDCKGRFTGYPDGDHPLSDYTALHRDGSRVPGV
jgi:hypothetical protein